MKLVYSELAIQSLEEIVRFLKRRWTVKEIRVMENDLLKFERTVAEGIIKHPNFDGYPNTKYALIGKKQIKIIYRIEEDRIIIAIFWHCKQDPSKLKDLL